MSKAVESPSKTVRIPAFDIMRGYFILVILVNHLAFFPSIFAPFTGRGQLWFSAAEGFMAISGLLVGYIYTKKFTQSAKTVSVKIWKRALKIYLATIGLAAFAMIYIALFWPEYPTFMDKFDGNVVSLIWNTLSLQYIYGYGEFLAIYVIFLALAPLALWLVSKKYGWIVAALSAGLWAFAYTSLERGANDYQFMRTSWQLLFFVSLVIGAYLPTIIQYLKKIPGNIRSILLGVLWTSALLIVGFSTFTTWGGEYIMRIAPQLTPVYDWWKALGLSESKEALSPLRIISGAVVFWAIFTFTNKFYRSINKLTNSTLSVIGSNSLYSYGVHAIIVFFVSLYLPHPIEGSGKGMTLIYYSLVYAALFIVLYKIVSLTPRVTSYFKNKHQKQEN